MVTFPQLTLKTSISIEDSPENKHLRLANHGILLLFDWSANQMCWSTSLGRVYHPCIRFWLVSQSDHNWGAWLMKDPRPSFLEESISFYFNENKDLIFLTPNSWARDVIISIGSMHWQTLKSVCLFSFDNLKVPLVLTSWNWIFNFFQSI